MDAVNWLLLNGAETILGFWELLKDLFVRLFSILDVILNPLLSPLLGVLNPICTRIGDVVYAVLEPLPVWVGLTILSTVAGVVMLVVFRYASNQSAIGRAKDDIKANLLALKLFKDDLPVMFRAQGRLLWAILRLQRYMLTPVLVMLLPMLLGLAQMGTRYQWRPLVPGERTLIRMKLKEDVASGTHVELAPCDGLLVEVGPIPGGGELVWRVRGAEPGRHILRFDVDGEEVEKELVVTNAATINPGHVRRVSALRVGSDWTIQLLHPAEKRLPPDSPVRAIEILYPGVDSRIYGSDWWVPYFFLVSMLTALIVKPLFKVRF